MTGNEPIMNPAPDSPDWSTHAKTPADSSSLVALVDADPEVMTGPALVDAIVASEKALSFLAATQLRLFEGRDDQMAVREAVLSASAKSLAAPTAARARVTFWGACAYCCRAEANLAICAAGEASSSGSLIV